MKTWFHGIAMFLVLELLLYGLFSSEENAANFLQLIPFTILPFLFRQKPITAEWTEVA